jgi:predicted regulator of Ras-like GTPase activity (Roadblock/LC7/MglB family)
VIEVLEPLTRIAGVRCAVLVSPDGVPVVARGKLVREQTLESAVDDNPDALAALATSWLQGLTNSVAPMSWEAPQRVVLRAARGTLSMCTVTGAILLLLLDTGVSAEDLRLPMEAAVARMKRVLRCARSSQTDFHAAPVAAAAPDAPLPARPSVKDAAAKGPAPVHADTSRKYSPREFPG